MIIKVVLTSLLILRIKYLFDLAEEVNVFKCIGYIIVLLLLWFVF